MKLSVLVSPSSEEKACLISKLNFKMFDSEDDSEDEEKVHEGSLSKAQGVSHGKAPPGILVSAICAPACCSQCAVRQGHHGRAQGPFFAS